jgi:YD repeat-containing protein
MNFLTVLIAIMSFILATSSYAATYTYDKLHRLTSVTYNSGQVIHYTYDPAGNLISVENLAESYQVEGYAQDESGKPLADVSVEINGQETTTNEEGYYQIDGLEAGTYSLNASKDGYNFESQEVIVDEENPNAQLTLVSTTPTEIDSERPTLCFVIDDTGSMTDEIEGVRDSLVAEIEKRQENESAPYSCLLTFKDKDEIHLRISTPHLDALLTEVKKLEAEGGDDCAEDSVVALNQAVDTVAPGSTLFLATDAPPHEGYEELTALIEKLRQQELTIEILLTEAYCVDKELTRKKKRLGSEHFERSVEAYSRIVREVGNGSSLNIIKREDQGSESWKKNYRLRASNLIASATRPTITALLPTGAPQGSTLDLDITATGAPFNASSLKNIQISGGIPINNSRVLSPSRLLVNVTIPKETAFGHYNITINQGEQTVSGLGVLEVIEAPETPTILSVTPTSKVRDQSALTVLVYGLNTHFNQSSQLSFDDDGIVVRRIKIHSDTFLEAEIDIRDTALLGLHDVIVTTGDEVAEEEQIGPFLVLDALPKTVTVLTPSTGLPLCAHLGNPITKPCDNHGQILYDRHIDAKGSVVGGKIGGRVTNEGRISNVTVLSTGQLMGGLVTGYVINEGIIADIEFVGAEISGGELAGTITINSDNNLGLGVLDNVSLQPDTTINGGQVTGPIQGPANGKAQLNAAKIRNAELANVIIGADCELAENVISGEGVRFTDNATIPENVDLTKALSNDDAIDITTDIVTEGPSLLNQINDLPDMQANDWTLVQNQESNELEVMIDGTRLVTIEILAIKQAKRHRKEQIHIHDDGTATVITTQGREILVQIKE